MIVIVCRKSIKGSIIDNVKKNDCGGLSIDKCRITKRWPANVLISEKSTQHFPQSLGWSSQNHNTFNMYGGNSLLSSSTQRTGFHKGYDDSGSASRYFKVVKEND